MRAMLSLAPGGPETLRLGELPDPTPGPRRGGRRGARLRHQLFRLPHHSGQAPHPPASPLSAGGRSRGNCRSRSARASRATCVGQRVVVGCLPYGGMAEKLLVRADYLNPMPEGMSFEVAAGYSLVYGTSYYGLKDCARMQPGETLLVLGAAGGVGLAAVELGKAMGARVIAAASTRRETPRRLGSWRRRGGSSIPAESFDAAGRKQLADLFKSACGPQGADVVFDPVGGDYSEAAVRCLQTRRSQPDRRIPRGRSKIAAQSGPVEGLPCHRGLLGPMGLAGAGELPSQHGGTRRVL